MAKKVPPSARNPDQETVDFHIWSEGALRYCTALAEPRFQAADAQRDSGQRQVERPGSGAETAVFEHGSQGFELIGVKHGCSIPPAR